MEETSRMGKGKSLLTTAGPSTRRRPWLFLDGGNKTLCFNPETGDPWRNITVAKRPRLLSVSGGFFIISNSDTGSPKSDRFFYAPVALSTSVHDWIQTNVLNSRQRVRPVVIVLEDDRFVVLGGLRYCGPERDSRAHVEIYSPTGTGGQWLSCPPLPSEFLLPFYSVPRAFSAALVNGRLLFVLDMYTGHISRLDIGVPLSHWRWLRVRSIQTNGSSAVYILIARRNGLLLVVVEWGFTIWDVDVSSCKIEVRRRLTEMPRDMYRALFPSVDGRQINYTCVGLDGVVYVVNMNSYAAAICDVEDGSPEWIMLPPVPSSWRPRAHEQRSAFCSQVPPYSDLRHNFFQLAFSYWTDSLDDHEIIQ